MARFPTRGGVSHAVSSFNVHSGALHAVEWHPSSAGVIASSGSDGRIVLCDARVGGRAVAAMIASTGDVLTLDWMKYNQNQVVAGAAEGSLSLWDVRSSGGPVSAAHSHRMPIKRVRASPHDASRIVVASYDMSVAVWDVQPELRPSAATAEMPAPHRLLQSFNHHHEFVTGVDWDCAHPSRVLSCGWDQSAVMWDLAEPPPARLPPTPSHVRAVWPRGARPAAAVGTTVS